MQNCRLPSFFLTNTTALHQALWLGLIGPDSSISCRWFQTSSTSGRGIHLNHSVTFIMCSVELVQPHSAGSNENTLWHLARSRWVASTSPGGQASNPLKSSSSNSFPCLCLTVNLRVWRCWGSSPPSCNWTSMSGLGTGSATTALATGSSSRGSVGKPYCSLPPCQPIYFLVSALCTCFVLWGPVAKSCFWSVRLVPWC